MASYLKTVLRFSNFEVLLEGDYLFTQKANVGM